MADEIIWNPSKSVVKNANITKFMERHEIKTYDELIQRATTGIEWFWDSCVHETDISWFEPYTQLVDVSEGFPSTSWFLGGRLNITHNCVDRHVKSKTLINKVAIIWEGECGTVKSMTYSELAVATNQVANYLRRIGVQKNDCIAVCLPMIPELIPIFFAILKIGAVVLPVSFDCEQEKICIRCQKAGVKVFFTADGTLRKGKSFSLKEGLDDCLDRIDSLKKCIVVKRLQKTNIPMTTGRDAFYEDVIVNESSKAKTEEMKSEDHALFMPVSEKGGESKETVHTHAGLLAQVTKEMFFNLDLKQKDVFYWVADFAEMMGPWEIIGATHFGSTLVIAEGSPDYPTLDRIIKQCKKYDVTHLGMPHSLVRLFMKGENDLPKIDLKKLRILGSMGEHWDSETYKWFFQKVGKEKLPIVLMSGDTEIMGSFLIPLIIEELKSCSLQSPGLGMAVDVFAEGGYAAEDNEEGYLVCRKPAPSMTKGFLKDNEGYLESLFSKFRNVWNQGRWVVCDHEGHWFLRGHVEDTIIISGKRRSPLELESCLKLHPFVDEACAICLPDRQSQECLICFVVLKPGIGETRFLFTELKHSIAKQCGKTMKSRVIYFVSKLPKNQLDKVDRKRVKYDYLERNEY